MFLSKLKKTQITNQLWSFLPSISESYTPNTSISTFFITDTPSTPTSYPTLYSTYPTASQLPPPPHYSSRPSLTPVVNNSNELGPVEELALAANETSVTLPNLKYSIRYKFYLNAKTGAGAGAAISQEAVIIREEGKSSNTRKI